MAQVEVTDLVAFVRSSEQQKGKYIKLILSNLELEGKLDKATRKIILDGVNGLVRSIYRSVGYDLED